MNSIEPTNGELADELESKAGQKDWTGTWMRMNDERGLLNEAARRLRETDGARVSGYVELGSFRLAKEAKETGFMRTVLLETHKVLQSNRHTVPAIIILKPEGEQDDG